ncbi:hypothetical protein ACFQ6Q_00125 [Streptomyces sp. NPDC056437]|uniref:hypothetical protein n=1 Tax=Streptomyces sp. NPDC056437 TaxID=3345816 RepID=UPI0036B9E90D
MSTQSLTRFLCDAPNCTADGIGSSIITPPDGWTKLQSTAHIPVTKSSPYPARRRGSRALTYSERCYGSFSLHLCPAHPDAFDAHQPITNGHGYNSSVSVSCSCGASLGTAAAATFVSTYPSHGTERVWFLHLPPELRWYLWRGQRQWATRYVSYGVEHIRQHPTQEQAQDLASDYKTVVYRDAEGEPWTPLKAAS